MATYQSTNDETRYYPTLGILVEPKQTVEVTEKVDAVGLEEVPAKATKQTQTADASAEGVSA